MKQNQKKTVLAISGILILIAILYYVGALPSFALLSQDYNVRLEDGKVYHVVTLTANDPNGGTYILKPQNKTLSNGSIVTSTETVSFQISPLSQKCEYQLTPTLQPRVCISTYCYNFNLWTEYVLKNAELRAPLSVSSSNGVQPIILEGANAGNRGEITDADGKGIATIETVGGFSASSYCPPSGGAIMVMDASGKPKVMDSAQYESRKQTVISQSAVICGGSCLLASIGSEICKACINNAVQDIKYGTTVNALASFHSTPIKSMEAVPYGTTTTKTMLRAVLDSGSKYANPAVIISADQDFVDSFLYSPPLVGKPKIVSFSTQSVPESKLLTRAVVFGNDGDSATFTYTVTAKLGTISPQQQSIEIQKDSEKQVTFSYTSPSVTADDEESITVKLCAGNQFGGTCTQKIFTFDIKNDKGIIPTPDPETEWCGNNKCVIAAGETYLTCPADCTSPTPTTCEATPNSYLKDNECVCEEGYLTRYDAQTGQKSCVSPEPDYIQYLQFAILGGAVLVLGYAVLSKPKIMYRRRGK